MASWGLADDEAHKEFLPQKAKDTVAEQWFSGKLKSVEKPPPTEMPAEERSDNVPKPALSKMVWGPEVDGVETLKMPANITQTWYDHEIFGKEFKELYHSLETSHGDLNPKKPAPPANPSPIKKQKVADVSEHACGANAMPGESLNEIVMASTEHNKAFWDFRTGEKVFIVNKSLVEVSLPEHTVVASYPVKGGEV